MKLPFDRRSKYLGLKISQWFILYLSGVSGYVIGMFFVSKKNILSMSTKDFLSLLFIFLTYSGLLLFNKFFPDEEIKLNLFEKEDKDDNSKNQLD